MTETPVTHALRSDLSIDQKLALKTAATRLRTEFEDTFGVATIERFLHTSYDQFAGRATIPNFLPLLAERFARQRLHALARVEGKIVDGKPTVLFLCTHNAGRSQMALGYFTHLAGDRAVAWSGGSEPGTEINPPAAIAAMAEVGIDITGEYPPNRGPTKSSKPPTSSSRWAAETPARCSPPESATRTGNYPIRPDRDSMRCARSAMTSKNVCAGCSPTSTSPSRNDRHPPRCCSSASATTENP